MRFVDDDNPGVWFIGQFTNDETVLDGGEYGLSLKPTSLVRCALLHVLIDCAIRNDVDPLTYDIEATTEDGRVVYPNWTAKEALRKGINTRELRYTVRKRGEEGRATTWD